MLCSPVVSIVKVIALACFSVKTLTDGRGSLFSPPFLVDQYYIGCFSNSDPQVNWLQAETPLLSTVSLYSPTPPIAEILCAINPRAIVVCGFLMKSL